MYNSYVVLNIILLYFLKLCTAQKSLISATLLYPSSDPEQKKLFVNNNIFIHRT